MGLRFTSAADYGVRAMIHLACLPERAQALREQIATAENIPSSFMAKILRSLVRAGLLNSARGVNGGFSLARDPEAITLLDIIEAVEGPIRLTGCSTSEAECTHTDDCPASRVWLAVQRNVQDILGGTTLEELVSTPRRNGKIIRPPLRVVQYPGAAGRLACMTPARSDS
jgi:Rrf2 family protein